LDFYIKSNKLGLYSQIVSVALKSLTYLFILKYISPSIYGESVFQLTLMGFSLILSDSGGSSSIYSHKKLTEDNINQYFSTSLTYSLFLTSIIFIFLFFQKDDTNIIIYIIISLLILFSPANNVLISVIQKYNYNNYFYFSRNFRDFFTFIFSLFLIYTQKFKLVLFLPQLFGEIILFVFLFKFINTKIYKIKYAFKIKKEVLIRNYYLFFTKILNYFSLNWIYLGFLNFNMFDVATLNMANSFWKNLSDSLKNIFQKSYIMIPYNNKVDVFNNSKYFLKFNLKYLIPIVLFSTLLIAIFLNYYANGLWIGSIKFVYIFGIFGAILFIFPPLTPVYIVNDKSRRIFKNSLIQFIFNIITIALVYVLKLPIIYAFVLTLTYQVISYLLLFIGLKKIFI
jgi:O-antigen/teichoic acid export membrane protein